VSVPQLQALDAVYDALQSAVVADVFSGLPVRIKRTLRPLKALEEIGNDLFAIVYPMECTSDATSTGWDEYLVSIAVELITPCTSFAGDEETQERTVATVAQTMCDEVRTRLTVTSGFSGSRSASGLLAEETRETLNLISSVFAHQFRIMHAVAT